MGKPVSYTFTVEGSGEFPVDMLRYDTCWPASSESAVRMERPRMPRKQAVVQDSVPNSRDKRQVVLMGNRQPTIKRWESFGWIVHPEIRSNY